MFSQISTGLAVADGAIKAAQVLEKVADINRALVKVKEGLHSVKVSHHDATEVQREIEGELFDKWHESCEVWYGLFAFERILNATRWKPGYEHTAERRP